jgi:tetratricopeptide (TPR) repeat protein
MKLTAQLIGAKTGYTFDVPAVTATSPDDAAQQVFTAFNNYVSQLFSSAMCQQYLGSQQWPNALENCNAALAINPRSETALMDKSRALLGMDSLDAAYATLQELIKVNPTNQDALRNAGVVAARLNKPQESRGYFRTYLELNPGDANVRLNLANDASKAGDPEGALSMVEDGFKADSANPNLLLFAGHWALAASQKLANDARAADKDPPARSDSLAMVALKYYQRLVAVQDTAADPTVVRNMMLIMLTHDQAAQAVALGGRYVAVHPKDAGLWSTYADALNANDQFSQALAALDSASANDPNHENKEGAKRGQWLAERGQLDAARVALREAVQSGSISADEAAQLVFGIGYNKYFRNNDYDRALDYFGATRDLASSAVTKGQANFWIGSIYFQRGRTLAQAATEAKTQAAAEKAAAQFRQAGTYFDQCAAFTARNPAVARNVQAMTDYIKQYVDAVRKAAR